jgi:hypothetical protein
MNEIWLAAIAAIAGMASGIIAPIALAIIANRARSQEKREDWERQDAVAAQAAEAAKLLLAANERVAKSTQATNGKLDVIHGLVNSNMTAALQDQLDTNIREVALMREVVALHRAQGRDPSKEALEAITLSEGKIGELRSQIADRLRNGAAQSEP